MHIAKINDMLKIYKYHIKPKGDINMKNKKTSYKKVHKKINGQTIHINKRWSDLKRTQREFIYNLMRKNYKQFIDENDKLPNKKEQSIILDSVYKSIMEKNINIPYKEVDKYFQSKITRFNKMHKLDVNKN